jgi:replicative DNA helicase
MQKKEAFFKTLIETGRLNIFYCNYTVDELVDAIFFLKERESIGLVAIDYMQMLRMNQKKHNQRQEELKEICLTLKDLAVDTGLPILIGAQFNRTVINERSMSPVTIGEAGDIERAANMIIGMWNRNYEGLSEDGNKGKDGKKRSKESAIYLEILKGRETGIGHSAVFDLNGNTGKITCRNNPSLFE